MMEFKEPKTEHSRRRVSMTPKLACYLREYKQQQEITRGRLLALDDLISCHSDGKSYDRSPVIIILVEYVPYCLQRQPSVSNWRFDIVRL
ncbi:MAG: hypothetical protein ABSA18_03840 [Dehalococcoidia bacterium]